jgi:hypothetical protein
MSIVLNDRQAMIVRGIGNRRQVLNPRYMTAGTFAVSENALTDPAFSEAWETLESGTISTPVNGDFPSAAPDRNADIFVSGQPYQVQADRKPWAFNVLGDNHYRFELRYGDQGFAGDTPDKHRVELYALNRVNNNTDIWMSYSMMIEEGPENIMDWMALGQWHPTADANDIDASASIANFLYGEDLRIITRYDTAATTTVNPAGTQRYTYQPTRGSWDNFVFRTKFHHTSGELDIWKNGVQIVNLTGIGMGYNDTLGPYYKFGIYGDATKVGSVIAVRFANMEWGTSSLSARVTTPLEIDTD